MRESRRISVVRYYSTAWRMSGKSDNSVTLTHKEAPGNAVLTIEWVAKNASQAADIRALYEERLKSLASETRKLEDVRIGGVVAQRYASSIKTGNSVAISLNVFLSSANTLCFVTFATDRDRFPKYAQQANDVISTLRALR